MPEIPYEPPSPASSTIQSDSAKTIKTKTCPSCGKDIGVWPFLRTVFAFPPIYVQCPNCRARCNWGQSAWALSGLHSLSIMSIVARSIHLWITTGFIYAVGFCAIMVPVSILLLFAVALFLRRYAELRPAL